MILKSFIANLPFSPAVAGQIGFYTQRLAREEMSRRIGLVLLSVALVMESFVLISPPQATLAAGPNNVIFGGITSKQDLLNRYDTNDDGNGHHDLQQLFTQFGITRDDLQNSTEGTLNSRDQNLKLWTMGRFQYNKPGEYKLPIDGTSTVMNVRPLWGWDNGSFGTTYKVVQGHTSDGRFFAVMFKCGNLIFNIDETETPEEPIGFAEHDCDAITGWAYDPNDTTKKTKVTVWIKLAGEATAEKKQIIADDANPTTPIGSGHGFTFKIPDSKKSDSLKTEYAVIAHDDTGKAKDVKLADNVSFKAPCLDPPEPEINNTPTGSVVKNQCRCIEGWAYDSDDLSQSVEVRLMLELEGNESEWFYETADRSKPKVGSSGNHGFKFDIEPESFDGWKSSAESTSATVQIKDTESGKWITISNAEPLEPTPCLEEEPPEEPVYCEFNPELLADDPACVECPYNPGLWVDSTECNEPFALIVRSKTARNVTQEIEDANGTTASPGDVIEYTLTAQNLGNIPAEVDFEESLEDVLEYADFVRSEEGDFDAQTKNIFWDSVELAADESITRTIRVKVKNKIPATPASTGNPESYNLKMTNVFGDDSVEIKVTGPASKGVEIVVQQLPNTGTGTNIMIMGLTAGAAVYMYMRNRQLSRELKMVRSEFNMGVA